MVETLTNLKNNKTKKDANIVAGDAVERMKKLLSGLGKKRQGVFYRLSCNLGLPQLFPVYSAIA